jgi:hypothetical protein
MLFRIYIGIGILIGFGQAIQNKDGSLLAGMTVFIVIVIVIQYIKIPKPKPFLDFIKNRIILVLIVLAMLGVILSTPFHRFSVYQVQSDYVK